MHVYIYIDVTAPSSLFRWETVQSCLLRYNTAEFFVRMGNASVFFPSNTVEISVRMTRFSVFMGLDDRSKPGTCTANHETMASSVDKQRLRLGTR